MTQVTKFRINLIRAVFTGATIGVAVFLALVLLIGV
jgi:hypothetical protein